MPIALRIEPTPKLAWLIGLLYGPIFITLLIVIGGDYDEITDSTDNLVSAVVIPMTVMTVLVVALTSWLGWWRPVLRDDRPTPRWMKLVPAVLAVGLVVGMLADSSRSANLETSFLLWAVIGTLLVGFCEEFIFRGLTVVGFRAGHRELYVWLFSGLLFAALHLWNFVAGQSLSATATQFIFSFVFGSVLYVCRRATGTIIIPILLHAAWDWVAFTGASKAYVDAGDAKDSISGSAVSLFLIVAVVLSLVGFKRLFTESADENSAEATSVT